MKRLLRHPSVQMNGFLRSGITLFRAAITPILLYSDDCWYGMSKNMVDNVEGIYRKMLYCFLDIPSKTKYESVLLELGLMKAENVIASHKICFINKIWNEDQDPTNKKLLLRDHRECNREGNMKSVIDEVNKLCRERGLLPVTNFYYDNEFIKREIIKSNDIECWRESMTSRLSTTKMQTVYKYSRYHDFIRSEGRAVLLWRCGALRFKRSWRNFYERKGKDMSCPHPLCAEFDTLEHAKRCPFMLTKVKWEGNEDKTMASFILRLNRERKKYQRCIVTW